MKNFNRTGGFSDKKTGGFGGRRDGGSFGDRNRGGFGGRDSGARSFGRDGGRPEMHRATCAECGSSCEVPFKPSGDKPVYCSNCFSAKEGTDSRRSSGRDFSRSSFGDKPMFKATCAECGESCEVPFKPNGDKPVYCSNCFKGKDGDSRRSGGSDFGKSAFNDKKEGGHSFDKQFEALNAKLDKIMQILGQTDKAAGKKEITVSTKEVKEAISKSEPKKIVKKELKKIVAPKVKKTVVKKGKKK